MIGHVQTTSKQFHGVEKKITVNVDSANNYSIIRSVCASRGWFYFDTLPTMVFIINHIFPFSLSTQRCSRLASIVLLSNYIWHSDKIGFARKLQQSQNAAAQLKRISTFVVAIVLPICVDRYKSQFSVQFISFDYTDSTLI